MLKDPDLFVEVTLNSNSFKVVEFYRRLSQMQDKSLHIYYPYSVMNVFGCRHMSSLKAQKPKSRTW